MLGVISSRDPLEWKSFDSSLPFLVKWRQCFPLWSRPNVSYFGRCVYDTGLDILGPMYPFQYKGSTRQKGVKTGSGYKSYIQNHMKDGPLSEVEYMAFLNMWLCRFIFCGKANEPTLNHIAMATDLATGHRIPLGKYLLGSVYHMLHQTISQMHTGQKISCVNGP
jgi:hypothetical protein